MSNRGPKNTKGAAIAVCIAALFSGAAALGYEISWSRMLVVPLGNSSDATAIVLCAFMLGMALGAWILGGIADRVKSPLKLYAWLELALGVYAIPMPLVIRWLGGTSFLTGSFEVSPIQAILRFAVFTIIVSIPSLVMGATLPVLVRAVSSKQGDTRTRVGLVYGFNTLGAATGATLAGFMVIPAVGLVMTSAFSAGFSFLAAFVALVLNKLIAPPPKELEQDDPSTGALAHLSVKRRRTLALLTAAVSGFVMLGAEVLYARVLTFVFGHDTYAFSVLLTFVLIGLGLGGLVHSKLSKRNPVALSAVILGLLALTLVDFFWVAASITVEAGRDPFNLGAVGSLGGSLRLELFRELLFAPILVLVPAVMAGTAFPAACTLMAEDGRKPGLRIGEVALVNGAAAAAGAVLVSFVLVSALGIQGSFVALALVGVAASLAILYFGKLLRPIRSAALRALPAVLCVLVIVAIPGALPKAMFLRAVGPNHQKIVHYEEGRTGTVAVTVNKINGEKQLFVNAVNEVTTRLVHDQSFKLLGHLGPLLHPNPKEGLMICFGAGLSAGAALVHPLKTLDVVELSSTIPGAAHQWKAENNDVLNDPRLRLHIDDGRHFLRGTDQRFDTITVDSTHPKAVDSWILYTKEFYALMKSKLADDGIAVQWVPLHGLSEREFKIIVRTFQTVFPNTTLWVNVGFETYGQAAYLKLVGTREPLLIDYKELTARLKEPRIRQDLAPFGMDAPEEILDAYLAGPRVTARWTEGLPIQTDNHPIVPFTTAYSKGRRMTADLLLGVRSSVVPILERMGDEEVLLRQKLATGEEVQGFLLAGMLDRALEAWPDGKKLALFEKRAATGEGYYIALAKQYNDDATKLFEIGSYLGNLGFVERARSLYEKALKKNPDDTRVRLNLAILLMDMGRGDQAAGMLEQLVRDVPGNPLVHYNLGVTLLKSGRPDPALLSFSRALSLDPELLSAKLNRAEAYLALGKLDRAERDLREVIATNRWTASAWDMLGRVEARRKSFDEAKTYHIRALELEPYRADSHYNLGIALQELGRFKEAAGAYQAALKINPQDADALNNLGLVYGAAQMYDKALAAHLMALDIDPGYAEAAFNTGLVYKALERPDKAVEFFGLALKLAPTLVQAQQQLDALGIDSVEVEVEEN